HRLRRHLVLPVVLLLRRRRPHRVTTSEHIHAWPTHFCPRLRGAAAPGPDRADPDRRCTAQLRHPQRHARRGDRLRAAPVARRSAYLARRPRHRRLGPAARPGVPDRPVPPHPPQGGSHMLNLAEYRRKTTGLCDYLPWACLIGPGIVLNKDGSFQRTIRYRGPDLDSATEAELVSVTARLNNVLKRFGEGWALFFEAERVPANQYPGARFADAASWLVDQERYAAFSGDGAHHESRYYLTLLYLPPPDREGRAERLLYERSEGEALEPDAYAQLEFFQTETARALELFSAILPEAEPLGDAETLTYLHGTVSSKRHPIAVPSIPAHLDAILCDTPLLGGVEPKLGDQHLRVLTILGFPNATTPGILDALNDLGFSYRWVTRWIAQDKTQATKHLTRLRRQWFAKRKSVGAILREVMFNRESALVDPDAENKALDADEALQELGADDVAFGHITTAIVVADSDPRRANDKLLAVERIVNGRGFATIRETLNAVEAWLGSLPGN